VTPARLAPGSHLSELTAAQRARRGRVIDAALSLSRRRTFEQIQVKDVSEEAGVALGTVYRYFSSKDHLFAEALVQWVDALQTNVTRYPLKGRTPPERLREVLHRCVRAFQRQPNLAKLVTALTVSSDPFAIEAVARMDMITSAVFSDALVGLDQRTVRAMVRMVYQVLDGLLRMWSAGRLSIVEVFDSLDDMVGLLFRP